jgi:hypothetical protein
MDTLMRMIKQLSLMITAIVLMASAAHAQGQDWTDRGYLTLNLGGQLGEQSFSDTSNFRIYDERGDWGSGLSIGKGQLYDFSAGARVWRNLGVGIGYSALKNKNDATVTVRVPHPVQFGQFREASATTPDLEHTENAVHLNFIWMMPLTAKFQLAFMAGPTFFTVRQEIASLQAPQEISDPPPFNNLRITSVTVTDYKESPVGANVGVDGT